MRVLQISCSYFPKKVGGTEVYVHNLSKELISRGHQVFINYMDEFCEENAPRIRTKEYVFEGLPVTVIEKNFFGLKTKQLYFESDRENSRLFKDYLQRIQPNIVHFHHFSPTDVINQMEVAKRMHLPVIFTYHTPTMTCGQSGMLYQGKRVCLGRVNYKRCLICAQTKYNIPLPIAWIWANLPRGIASALGKTIVGSGLRSRFATWLQLPWLTRARMDKWELGFKMIDRFVAVCQWVLELLLINNVPEEKITLCRQGIGQIPLIKKRQSDDILHLGYLGRINPVKGIDVLLRALKLIPSNLKVELSIYGSYGEDKLDKKYHDKLYKQYCNDSRIKWQGLLSEGEKFQALSQLDVLVIPSTWLETGPLVLLECWAAGTPVIGSNLGGIAELVNDGTNGLLFKRGDARGLSRLIMQVYNDPDLLEKLKTGIPGVRTMREVVDDMEILYQKVIK